jgi:hypothetical protein
MSELKQPLQPDSISPVAIRAANGGNAPAAGAVTGAKAPAPGAKKALRA